MFNNSNFLYKYNIILFKLRSPSPDKIFYLIKTHAKKVYSFSSKQASIPNFGYLAINRDQNQKKSIISFLLEQLSFLLTHFVTNTAKLNTSLCCRSLLFLEQKITEYDNMYVICLSNTNILSYLLTKLHMHTTTHAFSKGYYYSLPFIIIGIHNMNRTKSELHHTYRSYIILFIN